MNLSTIKGRWHEVKGLAKKKWGEITDDEIEKWEGDTERMIGSIQKTYGIGKEEAKKRVDDFIRNLQN